MTVAVESPAPAGLPRLRRRARCGSGRGSRSSTGRNGAGKTNLLEALYFGCTGRSCRTSDERQVVRFGAPAPRASRWPRATATVCTSWPSASSRASPSASRSTARRWSGLWTAPSRPLVSVFLPDRLELVKGPPALRRAHLDQVVAALWPSRAATRRAYAAALAQRNALLAPHPRRPRLARRRCRRGTPSSRATASRCAPTAPQAVERAARAVRRGRRRARARRRGGAARSGRGRRAQTVEELAAELAERPRRRPRARLHPARPAPRRPRAAARRPRAARLRLAGRAADRAAGAAARRARRAGRRRAAAPPLLLLDDVMSELDAGRRERLVERVARGRPGGHHHDRPRRTCRARTTPDVVAHRGGRRHDPAGAPRRGAA